MAGLSLYPCSFPKKNNLRLVHFQMSDENSAPELIAPVSGVVLSLMAHLRHSTLPSGEALESLPSRGAMASGWLDDGELYI